MISMVAGLVILPPAAYKGSLWPISLPAFVVFLRATVPTRVKWNPGVVLVHISLMVSKVELLY